MKVKEVMSAHNLDRCAPETDLATAAKQMRDTNRGVLPVVNKKNKVIGMITDRDICLGLAERPFTEPGRVKVSEVMSGDGVYAVRADDDISIALREMRKHRVNRLPVTNGKGELSGILTLDGLLAQAVTNHVDLGSPRAKRETIARTIKTIYERNASTPVRKGKYLPAENEYVAEESLLNR